MQLYLKKIIEKQEFFKEIYGFIHLRPSLLVLVDIIGLPEQCPPVVVILQVDPLEHCKTTSLLQSYIAVEFTHTSTVEPYMPHSPEVYCLMHIGSPHKSL